jgi:hypothetical protein
MIKPLLMASSVMIFLLTTIIDSIDSITVSNQKSLLNFSRSNKGGTQFTNGCYIVLVTPVQ